MATSNGGLDRGPAKKTSPLAPPIMKRLHGSHTPRTKTFLPSVSKTGRAQLAFKIPQSRPAGKLGSHHCTARHNAMHHLLKKLPHNKPPHKKGELSSGPFYKLEDVHPEFFKHVPDILQCTLLKLEGGDRDFLKHVLVILQCTLLTPNLLFAQADILPGYRQWPFSYDGRVKSLAKTPP